MAYPRHILPAAHLYRCKTFLNAGLELAGNAVSRPIPWEWRAAHGIMSQLSGDVSTLDSFYHAHTLKAAQPNGVFFIPITCDPQTHTRTYSTTVLSLT